MTDGMDELRNLIEMNGHPVFVTPLYGGPDKSWGDNPNPVFHAGDDRRGVLAFVERYQRLVAFELTKKYRVVFTRSIDMVDYFRRHNKVTPRTVFSSKTRHLHYDAWWTQGSMNNYGVLTTPERIPWSTRLSTVRMMRETPVLPNMQSFLPLKDPLSCEFILIEEQNRQLRFERECPSPIWWFDYARVERSPKGSVLSAVEMPEVQILRAQNYDKDSGLTITLTMKTEAQFPGYAIAVWNLPIEYSANPHDIHTTAQSYTLVKNTDGDTQMVLTFDLKPDAKLKITLRKPKLPRWEW